MNEFHAAIWDNDLNKLKTLLTTQDDHVRANDINGFANDTGLTPLQLAFFLERFDMAVLLLIYGAKPNHRKDDTHHLLVQCAQQRQCGDAFTSLIFLAPGIDPSLTRYFPDIKINPEVFHILFYSALKLNLQYAERLLKETLPSLNTKLRTQLILSLTGALYYSVKMRHSPNYRYEIITESLAQLGVPEMDPNLPNPGVTLLGLTQNKNEEKPLPLLDVLRTKNYLAFEKAFFNSSAETLPLNTVHLPWKLFRGKNFYREINTLIRDNKWDELKQFQTAGYSVSHHLYLMVINREPLNQIIALKNYYHNAEQFFDLLRNMFIFAMCDTAQIHEGVLNKLLNVPILKWTRTESDEDKKAELPTPDSTAISFETRFKFLEKRMNELKASSGLLNKFKKVREEFLHPSEAQNPGRKLKL